MAFHYTELLKGPNNLLLLGKMQQFYHIGDFFNDHIIVRGNSFKQWILTIPRAVWILCPLVLFTVFVGATSLLYVLTGLSPKEFIREYLVTPRYVLHLTPSRVAETKSLSEEKENKMTSFFSTFKKSNPDRSSQDNKTAEGLVNSGRLETPSHLESKTVTDSESGDSGSIEGLDDSESQNPSAKETRSNETWETPSYFRLEALNQRAKPLSLESDPTLLRHEITGLLPIRFSTKMSRKVYAKPFENINHKPMIAIVITGLGLSSEGTQAAIEKIPAEVSLSFSPYANQPKGNLMMMMRKAKFSGHEVLLDLPLETSDINQDDSGPLALMTSPDHDQAMDRLMTILSQSEGYVGLTAIPRSPFMETELWPKILQDIDNRGLLLVAGRRDHSPQSGRVAVSMIADEKSFHDSIEARLNLLIEKAKTQGYAVAYLSAKPVSLVCLQKFIKTLEDKNVILAPISAIVDYKK